MSNPIHHAIVFENNITETDIKRFVAELTPEIHAMSPFIQENHNIKTNNEGQLYLEFITPYIPYSEIGQIISINHQINVTTIISDVMDDIVYTYKFENGVVILNETHSIWNDNDTHA